VCKTFFFEGADEALLHGDAAMSANCAEPGANVVVVAPFEVVLAELAALIITRCTAWNNPAASAALCRGPICLSRHAAVLPGPVSDLGWVSLGEHPPGQFR